jgi:hypothetical protein
MRSVVLPAGAILFRPPGVRLVKYSSVFLGALLIVSPCLAEAQSVLSAASGPAAPSLTTREATLPGFSVPARMSSSSSWRSTDLAANELPEAPEPALAGVRNVRPPLAVASHTLPFSTFAIALTTGLGGVGVDVATPLNSRINLRGGVGFFSYTTSFIVDTVPIDGTLHIGNAHASVDWFLFNNSFHISPGITLYNNTNYNAIIHVPANQVITLNDQDYTSDPADPIRGTAYMKFGGKVAPRLTVGWGNMIPHKDKNWTFPFEFGLDYRSAPTATFALIGSSCDSSGDCEPIQEDPDTQVNILEQQQEITHDLAPLRFFPVSSFGVSYKFGH